MIVEGTICTRCGHPLRLDDEMDGYDEAEIGTTYTLQCDYCGAIYECAEVSESEKPNYEFYQNEKENVLLRRDEPDIMNGYCTNCGHPVSMSNNFMLSDYDDTVESLGDDDKMNFVLGQCPFCGMMEVRWDTSENEKKIYPYWKQDVSEDETTDPSQLATDIVNDLKERDKEP